MQLYCEGEEEGRGEMEEAQRKEKIRIIGEKRFGGRRRRKRKDEKLL